MNKSIISVVLFLFCITFVSTIYPQEGIHCTINAVGTTGMQTCGFYASSSYGCEIEAYNVCSDCDITGYVQYVCTLYVKKNGIPIASTPGWLTDYCWDYWSTWFSVNARDYIEITVVWETYNFCVGVPYNDHDLTVIDAIHMSKPTNQFTTGESYEFKLEQNYPNPFNPITTIKYSIPDDGFVKLAVYNTLGEEVTVLVDEQQVIGNYEVEFNAASLPSGVYLYRLETKNYSTFKKLILMK